MTRYVRMGFTLVALLAAAGFIAAHIGTASQVVHTLGRGQPEWVLTAIGLQGIFFLTQAALWQQSFAAVGVRSRLGALMPVWFASVLVGTAVPASGPAVFLADAARRGESPARAAAAATLVRIADLGSLLLLIAGALAYLRSHGRLMPQEATAALLLGLIVCGWTSLLLLGRRRVALLERVLEGIARAVAHVAAWFHRPSPLSPEWSQRSAGEFTEAATLMGTRPARLLPPFLVALAAHLVDMASLRALCLAFHAPVGAGVLLAAFAGAVLFWTIGVTPQGIGIVEGVMTATLAGFGISLPTAAAIALAFRGLALYLPLVVGLFFARRFAAPSSPKENLS